MEDWVEDASSCIKSSPVWDLLCSEVFRQLSETRNSGDLGRLDDAELMALCEGVHHEMAREANGASRIYRAFEWQFSRVIDEAISREARRRVATLRSVDEGKTEPATAAGAGLNVALATRRKLASDSTAALVAAGSEEALFLQEILRSAESGVSCLLDRSGPQAALRLFLGRALPARLQPSVWRRVLQHTKARRGFEILSAKDQAAIISRKDVSISQRCQALLEMGRVQASKIIPCNNHVLILMKTVLSYHETSSNVDVRLPEEAYYWVVPLLRVVGAEGGDLGGGLGASAAAAVAVVETPNISAARGYTSSSQVLPALVETFEALLESRDGPLQLCATHWRVWGSVVHDSVNSILTGHISKLHQKRAGAAKRSSQSNTATTVAIEGAAPAEKTAAPAAASCEALASLLGPLVRQALVGWVSGEACLFAWDQAVIAGFEIVIPLLAGMTISILQDPLCACNSFEGMQAVLKSQGPFISVHALQERFEQVMPRLRDKLRVGEGLSLSVVGPSFCEAAELFENILDGPSAGTGGSSSCSQARRETPPQQQQGGGQEHQQKDQQGDREGQEKHQQRGEKKEDQHGQDRGKEEAEGGADDDGEEDEEKEGGEAQQREEDNDKQARKVVKGEENRGGEKEATPPRSSDADVKKKKKKTKRGWWG